MNLEKTFTILVTLITIFCFNPLVEAKPGANVGGGSTSTNPPKITFAKKLEGSVVATERVDNTSFTNDQGRPIGWACHNERMNKRIHIEVCVDTGRGVGEGDRGNRIAITFDK